MSRFLDKAPDVRDLEIQSNLNKLCENELFNQGDGGSSNNFFPPSPLPPPLSPNFPNPRLPPLSSDLLNIPNVARVGEFLNNNDLNFDFSNGYIRSAPDPPPLRRFARNFFPNRPSTAKFSSNLGTNTTQAMSSDCLIGELKRVLEKEKPKKEINPDEYISFSLPKIPTILDNEDFEIKQKIKKQKDDETN